jgi:co-chaperonin GroES (HSP10)
VTEIGRSHEAIDFRPIDDNVVIRLVAPAVPSQRDAVAWGEVVAVGPGRGMSEGILIAPGFSPGDRVALRPGSAMRVTLAGESLAIVGRADVLGFVPRDAAALTHRTTEAIVAGPEAEPAVQELAASPAEESLETDVAPDLLDREAPTSEDLH